jgi:hypothetical protein
MIRAMRTDLDNLSVTRRHASRARRMQQSRTAAWLIETRKSTLAKSSGKSIGHASTITVPAIRTARVGHDRFRTNASAKNGHGRRRTRGPKVTVVVIAVLRTSAEKATDRKKPSREHNGQGTKPGIPNRYPSSALSSEWPAHARGPRTDRKDRAGRQVKKDRARDDLIESRRGKERNRCLKTRPHTTARAAPRMFVAMLALKATHSAR